MMIFLHHLKGNLRAPLLLSRKWTLKCKKWMCCRNYFDKNLLYLIKYGSAEYNFCTDEQISLSAIHRYKARVSTTPISREIYTFCD